MLSDLLKPLTNADPLLVWGLFTRGVGLVCLISFVSLLGQVVSSAGRDSGGPIHVRLKKFREDFDWRRLLYFPTLLWLNDSDRMLRLLVWTGIIASASIVYGGPHTPYAFFVCYLCYLSLDLAVALIFPWDALLFETMVLSIFLPSTHTLPDLTASAAPPPLLAWAFRLLVFRVMFGFGKLKFFGSTSKDMGYLKGFLTAQPLPSYIGWYFQKLPLPILRLMLVFMFFVEIPVPFFVFFPGDLSVIAALCISVLMVGIQTMGSFGYFSLLTICACIPLLDNQTPELLDFGRLFGPGEANITNAFVLFHTLGAIIVFPFNSWIAQTWSLWSFYFRIKPQWLVWPITVLRALHPFRWLHPYGVFPPKAYPSPKGSVLVGVKWEGEDWVECDFKFFPCNAKSKPTFVAPYHPRGDQAVIYETYGLNPGSLIASLAGPWDPYTHGTRPGVQAFLQRVLEGHAGTYLKCPELQTHAEPPKYARVVSVLLEPETLANHFKTGNYWRRSYLGPHAPPQQYDPEFWEDFMPEPELWHWEAIVWRRRSRLKKLLDRAAAREEPHAAVIADIQGQLSPEHVEQFWNDFIPTVGLEDRVNWDNLPKTIERVRARYDRRTRRLFERLLGRYSAMLAARLEPHYLGQGFSNPEIPVRTYLHLWMLIQHVIGTGRAAFDEVYDKPLAVVGYVGEMTIYTGMYYLCIFRYEQMIFDAQKFRLMRAIMGPYEESSVPPTPAQQKIGHLMNTLFGYFEVAELMMKHFKGPEYDQGYPERYPKFEVAASGEVTLKTRAPSEPTDPLTSS